MYSFNVERPYLYAIFKHAYDDKMDKDFVHERYTLNKEEYCSKWCENEFFSWWIKPKQYQMEILELTFEITVLWFYMAEESDMNDYGKLLFASTYVQLMGT